MTPTVRTLYEDWTARRAALDSSTGSDLQAAMARILDYLLTRYRNAPEAQAPARAQPRRELCVNDRALVLHAHLGHGQVAGVQSSAAARRRVSEVLARLQTQRLDHNPRMVDPSAQLRHKARRTHDELLRMLLGAADERMDGIRLLWMLGDLHDVGLFCDLLEMPLPADGSEQEREAMLIVLERLSERQRWSAKCLYENWRERYWACQELWVLGGETAEVGPLLSMLLQQYLDRPEARAKAISPSGVETAPDPRVRIVAAYTSDVARPEPAAGSFEQWRDALPLRGHYYVARAPEAEVQYWTNLARRQLIDADESRRLAALKMLTEVGDLQDVGLMCDLLALRQDGQTTRERAAMVQVVRERAVNWYSYLRRAEA